MAGALVAVLALTVLDQWSKGAVFGWLGSHPPQMEVDVHGHRRLPVAGEWLGLMTSCNPGAAFGRFGDYPEVLVVGRTLAVVFLLWFLVRGDLRQRSVLVAVALVLAGATGNLIDTLWTGCAAQGQAEGARPYGVRDFIDVWFESLVGWDYHFPSFNVADSCISVGACLWVLSGLLHRGHPESDAERPGTDGADGPDGAVAAG